MIISKRKADGDGIKEEYSEGNENAGLEACAEDILRAINDKDSKHLALALKAAFDVMESEPEEENNEDFDSQNQKAANEAQE